ncbi:MAG: alpha-ketoacid dehydrogenase subunit beta [Candidatus Nanohaloarchaea archaeon]
MKETQNLNVVEAVNEALRDELEQDDDVIVYGEDVGEDGGVFRATKELQEEFGEERVFSSPLAESGIAGTAIGMSLYGMRPVFEMQFSGFSYLAFHQMKEHASRMRTRSRGDYDVPITMRAPYGGGISALEHHQESPETFFTHSQLHVICPGTPQDTYSLLRESIRLDDPVVFLEPKKIYRAFKEEVDPAEERELGRADIVEEGEDLTLVTWGAMLPLAKEKISEMDADIELVDLRTINPADYSTVIDSVEKTGRAAVLHEARRTGGMGAEIAARIQEEALLKMEAPVERITAPSVPYPLYRLEDYFMPDGKRLEKGLERALEF